MPKGKKAPAGFDLKLFERTTKTRTVKAAELTAIRATAALHGIPPVALEITKRLIERGHLEKPDALSGEAFELSSEELRRRGEDVLAYLLGWMRRAVKVLGPGGVTVKGTRHADDLVFWLQKAAGPGRRKPA